MKTNDKHSPSRSTTTKKAPSKPRKRKTDATPGAAPQAKRAPQSRHAAESKPRSRRSATSGQPVATSRTTVDESPKRKRTPRKRVDTTPSTSNVTRLPAARPTHDAIAREAYLIWHENGRPDGQHLVHWLQAEERLMQAG